MAKHEPDSELEPNAQRPVVVQSEDLSEEAGKWLAERCQLVRCPFEDPRFFECMRTAEALVVRTYTRVDNNLLSSAPALKVVGRAGVGLDNIDLEACAAHGVRVVYTPDANTSAVAELVVAFMLDAVRPRTFLDRPVDAARWKALRRDLQVPRQLCEMNLGVLGLGRIGRRMAELGSNFGMRVRYTDLETIPVAARHGAEPVTMAELFATSDILTIHVDGRPSNRHLVTQSALQTLPRGAVLINTSRGFVVERDGLAAWLRADSTAHALLDVHDPEPIGADDPLLPLPNAYLSPHIGAATDMAHRNMGWVVRDVWRVLCGQAPVSPAV